jgi:hypothetical protein
MKRKADIGLIAAIATEPLHVGMRNLVCRYIINVPLNVCIKHAY